MNYKKLYIVNMFYTESKTLNRVCIYVVHNERRAIIYDNNQIVMKTISWKLIFELEKYIYIQDF